jgi:hypothetical protein
MDLQPKYRFFRRRAKYEPVASTSANIARECQIRERLSQIPLTLSAVASTVSRIAVRLTHPQSLPRTGGFA